MMKRYLSCIVALLFLIAIASAYEPAAGAPAPGTGSIEIHFRTYGGLTVPANIIRELVVKPDIATYTVRQRDGSVKEYYEKPLTPEQFDAIVGVFRDNSFDRFRDRYDPGITGRRMTDRGFSDITYREGGRSKTVTVDRGAGDLPHELDLVIAKLRETVDYTRASDEREARQIAVSWITGAPTYAYDGSGLRFVKSDVLGKTRPLYELTYRFTSSHAGYGDRSGSMTAAVLTEHTIVVTVFDRSVESAIIDDRWDEIGQVPVPARITLAYQPSQCGSDPWDIPGLVPGGDLQPAADEDRIINAISTYYQTRYGIPVWNVTLVDAGIYAYCDDCGCCPASYYFTLEADEDMLQQLLDDGWVLWSDTVPEDDVRYVPVVCHEDTEITGGPVAIPPGDQPGSLHFPPGNRHGRIWF